MSWRIPFRRRPLWNLFPHQQISLKLSLENDFQLLRETFRFADSISDHDRLYSMSTDQYMIFALIRHFMCSSEISFQDHALFLPLNLNFIKNLYKPRRAIAFVLKIVLLQMIWDNWCRISIFQYYSLCIAKTANKKLEAESQKGKIIKKKRMGMELNIIFLLRNIFLALVLIMI